MNPNYKTYFEEHGQEVLDLLKDLVEINSFTHNPTGVNRVGRRVSAFLTPLGFKETVHERTEIGNHRVFTRLGPQNGAKLLFLVHLDTVFPEDTGFTRLTMNGERALGPGVIDM